MDGWGKVKPAAKHAGVSERTLRKWLKRGLKHSRLPSGTILIRYSDIDEFLGRFAVNAHEVDEIVDEVCQQITKEGAA